MSVMKLEYAEDIYDIPYEEDQNGLLNPKFKSYGRMDMTPLERKESHDTNTDEESKSQSDDLYGERTAEDGNRYGSSE